MSVPPSVRGYDQARVRSSVPHAKCKGDGHSGAITKDKFLCPVVKKQKCFHKPILLRSPRNIDRKKNHIEVQCELRGNQKYQFKV